MLSDYKNIKVIGFITQIDSRTTRRHGPVYSKLSWKPSKSQKIMVLISITEMMSLESNQTRPGLLEIDYNCAVEITSSRDLFIYDAYPVEHFGRGYTLNFDYDSDLWSVNLADVDMLYSGGLLYDHIVREIAKCK